MVNELVILISDTIINSCILYIYVPPKRPKNDSHDFQKYKTLDTIIIIIIDAITKR